MADNFERCIARVLEHEGGYSRLRADPGNWTGGKVGIGELKGTKYGIAANTYPTLDIERLTLADAKAIYRRDFWMPARCDDVPDVLRFQLLDAAVNHGIGRALKLLQRSLGVVEDGVIGPRTLAAMRAVEPNDLALRFIAVRIQFYTDLRDFDVFGRGWTRRMAENILYVAEDN